MEKILKLLKMPFVRIGLGLGVLVIVGAAAGGLAISQIPPQQPIQFPHNVHVGLGAQCIYCHPAVTWGPDAGLPTTDKCWGCHQQVQKKSPELEKLAEYARANSAIPWVPVAIQPDFVHFNHQNHIAAQINCETCHGEISKMTVAKPQPRQNMGWCLNCHQKMRPDDFTRLSDCSLCHY